MIANNNTSTSFNDFEELSYIPYRIIEAMLTDTSPVIEDFWKVLKYNTVDCLDKPNLSLSEKRTLIWTGDSIEDKYSVFVKPLIGSAIDTSEAQTQLRIYRYATQPIDQFSSIVCFSLDVITNEKTSLVKNKGMLVERTDLMESLLLNFLNGRDIVVGSGFLSFDKTLTRSCGSQLTIGNSKTFYGRQIIVGLNYTCPSMGGDTCG